MNNVKKNDIEAQASKIVRKPCGRCGTAIEENDFCPACRDFFRELSGRKVVFATGVRRTPGLGRESVASEEARLQSQRGISECEAHS